MALTGGDPGNRLGHIPRDHCPGQPITYRPGRSSFISWISERAHARRSYPPLRASDRRNKIRADRRVFHGATAEYLAGRHRGSREPGRHQSLRLEGAGRITQTVQYRVDTVILPGRPAVTPDDDLDPAILQRPQDTFTRPAVSTTDIGVHGQRLRQSPRNLGR